MAIISVPTTKVFGGITHRPCCKHVLSSSLIYFRINATINRHEIVFFFLIKIYNISYTELLHQYIQISRHSSFAHAKTFNLQHIYCYKRYNANDRVRIVF